MEYFTISILLRYSNRRLLWADALEDNIGQVDFNGKRRQTIVPYAPHPFGLTLVRLTTCFTIQNSLIIIHNSSFI